MNEDYQPETDITDGLDSEETDARSEPESDSSTDDASGEPRPVCSYNKPLLSLSPSAPVYAEPGAPIEFLATVTNTNSYLCGNASFYLTAKAARPGWDVEVDSKNLEIAPEWSAGSANIIITSPPNAVDGSYFITVNTYLSNNRSFSATSIATYVVESHGAEPALVVEPEETTWPCVVQIPQISLFPASQGAGTTTDASTVYTVSVTNQDSAECPESTFSLGHHLPAGLEGHFSSSTLSLLPGETGVASLAIAQLESAAPGIHDIELTVTDPAEAQHTAGASTEFMAAAICRHAAPSLSLSPLEQDSDAGTTRGYTVELVNNDSPPCESSVFDLTITYLPEGWTGRLSSRRLSLSPGNTRTTTLSVSQVDSAAAASYRLQVAISDANVPIHSGAVSSDEIGHQHTAGHGQTR